MCSVRGAASTPTLHRRNSLGQAAFAISATRSQVAACRLGRASIRASHATMLACGAPSTGHSGLGKERERELRRDGVAGDKGRRWPHPVEVAQNGLARVQAEAGVLQHRHPAKRMAGEMLRLFPRKGYAWRRHAAARADAALAFN